MKLSNSIISALWLGLATFSLTQAGPLASRSNSPPPTRPFSVAAFQSPSPVGQGLTGYNLTARNGNFYLSPNHDVQKAILFVSDDGEAYLDSKKYQHVYIDTSNGLLAYADNNHPAPAGAIFVYFVHLGKGNQILFQGTNNGFDFTSNAPGTFQWIGQPGNSAWFACGPTGGEYRVYKLVSDFGGDPDVSTCIAVSLSALDYSGPNPAVDSY